MSVQYADETYVDQHQQHQQTYEDSQQYGQEEYAPQDKSGTHTSTHTHPTTTPSIGARGFDIHSVHISPNSFHPVIFPLVSPSPIGVEATHEVVVHETLRGLLRPAMAELIGSALFVFIACGTGMSTQAYKNDGIRSIGAESIGIALSFGMSIFVIAYSIGHISGGHLNFAVTFTFACLRKISILKCGLYFLAQFIGGLIGIGFLMLVTPDEWKVRSDMEGEGGRECERDLTSTLHNGPIALRIWILIHHRSRVCLLLLFAVFLLSLFHAEFLLRCELHSR